MRFTRTRRSSLPFVALGLAGACCLAVGVPGVGRGDESGRAVAGDELRFLIPSPHGEGIAVLRWTGQTVEQVDAAIKPHPEGQIVQIRDPCDASSTLIVSAEALIARPVRLSAERCTLGEPVALDWLPAGRLRGRIKVSHGEAVPTLGRLAVARCPGLADEEVVSLGEYPVRFGDDGTWSTQVPGGCLDRTG